MKLVLGGILVASHRNTSQANVSKSMFTESRNWEFLAWVDLMHEQILSLRKPFSSSLPRSTNPLLCFAWDVGKCDGEG